MCLTRAGWPSGAGNSYGVPVITLPGCYRGDTPTECANCPQCPGGGFLEFSHSLFRGCYATGRTRITILEKRSFASLFDNAETRLKLFK